MSIQGKAIIELTDVNTGEVEVVEENNLVTNGAKLFYEKGLNHQRPISSQYVMINGTSQPAVYDLFGGVIIFSEALTEDPDNYDYPSCDTIATACAGRTNVAAAKLGSYNSAESGKIENGYKFVFDFSTSQANGEIGSVCLTPRSAATYTYGQNQNEYVQWDSRTCELVNNNVLGSSNGCATTHYTLYTLGSGIKADMHLFFDDTYIYNVKLRNVLYNASYASSHISQTKELVIEKRLIDNTLANIFDYSGGLIAVDDTITIPIDGTFSAANHICQYVEGRLYVYATAAVNDGSILTIYVIDVNTWTHIDTIKLLNETGLTWTGGGTKDYCYKCVLPNDYFYTASTDDKHVTLINMKTGVHKFATTNDGTKLIPHRTGYGRNYIKFTKTLLLITAVEGNTVNGYAINIETGKGYRIPDAAVGYNGNYIPFYKKGCPNLCNYELNIGSGNADYSKMMFLPFILMTINNLSSKVIKTSDKTMKITYILYDDTVTT